ncbi:MAG: AAA family ATPase [Planctomycetota bacterium]|nr:AAA family ATPase [Planctomycetota bacterium]
MLKLLRVAVSGAHGVGKTTLVNEVHRILKAEGMSVEVALEPYQMLRDEFQRRGKEALYQGLLVEHFERLTRYECACCLYDRTLLDFLAYTIVDPEPVLSVSELIEILLPCYLEVFQLHLYLPVEFSLEEAGRKPEEDDKQSRIDRCIRKAIAHFEVPIHEVRGSTEERAQQTLELIRPLCPAPQDVS